MHLNIRLREPASIMTFRLTLTHMTFDLDLLPTTLTFNPSLFKVTGYLHAKNKDHMSIGMDRR